MNARARYRADQGFTLVELMVYIILFGIVGTMVAMLVWNGYKSQLNVTETTYNTGNMQNAAALIDHDVRYAAAFSITNSGTMLRTRTWVGDPDAGAFQCHAWYYDAASKTLRHTSSAGDTMGASASSAASWDVYVDGVVATSPFTATDTDTVRVRLTGRPDAWGRNTGIDTSIVQRPQSEDGGAPCF